MKLSLLCFAFGALAATIQTRDAATVAKDVQAVTDAVNDFDTTITSFSGQADAEKVKSKLDAVHSALAQGATDAKASDNLAQDEAITLASPVQDLAKAVQQTLTDLSGKKDALVSAGIAQDVYKKLTEVDAAQQDFVSTVLQKIPPTLAPVATGIIKPAQDKLASVITEFQGAGGASSGSSSGSSSPAPAPAPAIAGDKGPSSAPAETATTPPASPPAGYAAPSPTSSSAAPVASAPSFGGSNTTASAPTGTFTPAAYTGAAVPNAGKGSLATVALVIIAGLAL